MNNYVAHLKNPRNNVHSSGNGSLSKPKHTESKTNMKSINVIGKININISSSTTAELVKFYNDNSGSKAIVKFSDRATAERRVAELIKAHNELAGPTSKETKTKKMTEAPIAPSAPKTKKSNARGRTSSLAGKTLVKLSAENPRREGTNGWKSWNLISEGMTYEQFIAAGGRRVDLAWDLKAGHLELK